MVFQIWPRVKAANPHLSSVCELGAIVGSMWRDLDPADKQYYNDLFSREKVGTHCSTVLCYTYADDSDEQNIKKCRKQRKNVQLVVPAFTSSKEGMFYWAFVCLSVSTITQKIVEEFW